jgi:phosphohistidine phosphatase
MKTLLLLRHAKSSWKDSDIDDHERPLNKRGKRDAPRIGRLLREESLLPDLILASSAKRCRKTAEHVIHASGYRGEVRITGDLYEARADKLRQVVGSVSDTVERLLVIGHNPGLEEFLESLVATYTPLTTAALAHLTLPGERWNQWEPAPAATLHRVWQPRELAD